MTLRLAWHTNELHSPPPKANDHFGELYINFVHLHYYVNYMHLHEQDFSDAKKLLSRDNIVEEKLCKYSTEAASWSTELPKLEFAVS